METAPWLHECSAFSSNPFFKTNAYLDLIFQHGLILVPPRYEEILGDCSEGIVQLPEGGCNRLNINVRQIIYCFERLR